MNREQADALYNRAMVAADEMVIDSKLEEARTIRDIADAFYAYWGAVDSMQGNISENLLSAQRCADAQYRERFGSTCRTD